MAEVQRVLHVITGLGVGGAESMLTSLAMSPLLKQRVVSLTPGGPHRRRLEAAGVPVSDLGMIRSMPSLEATLRLVRIIDDFRPDVIQSWMYHADLTALTACYLSRQRKKLRLVWGIRCSDMNTSYYSPALRLVIWLSAKLSAYPDAVIANSFVGRDVHQALGYAPRRFDVIPNGIDVVRYAPSAERRMRVRAQLGIGPDVPVVAHVARVDPMKDHAGFMAAMERLPHVHALLIGAGTEHLAAGPNIHCLGRREDVPDLLPAADMVASSSLFGEGFSNALAEGMACGLPAVATDVGDAAVVLGDTGEIVPSGRPDVLASAIARLVDEPEAARIERSAAARRHIVENFGLDKIAERFAEYYGALS